MIGTRISMDYKVEADIVRSLGQISKATFIRRETFTGTDCESARGGEVEHQDRETWTVDVAFQSRIRPKSRAYSVFLLKLPPRPR